MQVYSSSKSIFSLRVATEILLAEKLLQAHSCIASFAIRKKQSEKRKKRLEINSSFLIGTQRMWIKVDLYWLNSAWVEHSTKAFATDDCIIVELLAVVWVTSTVVIVAGTRSWLQEVANSLEAVVSVDLPQELTTKYRCIDVRLMCVACCVALWCTRFNQSDRAFWLPYPLALQRGY